MIIGMHHDQDIRNMGGLRKYMPITWITSLIGSLALIGTPFFAGFYSKDSIIEAVHASHLPGAGFAYFAVLAGVFVTAFYSFRMYFLVFHGKERFDHEPGCAPRHDATTRTPIDAPRRRTAQRRTRSPWVVTVPLMLLAIPSVVIGYLTIGPMLFGDFFKDAIFVDAEQHPAMAELAAGVPRRGRDGAARPDDAAVLAGAGRRGRGLVHATWCNPALPAAIKRALQPLLHRCSTTSTTWTGSTRTCSPRGARLLGVGLWKGGDAGRDRRRAGQRQRARRRLGRRRACAGSRPATSTTTHSR